MSEASERDEVALVLAGEDKPCRKALAENPDGCVGEYGWCLCRKTADAILTSDWLAERDRRVAATVLRAASKAALDDCQINAHDRTCDCAETAQWLNDRADRIEGGR